MDLPPPPPPSSIREVFLSKLEGEDERFFNDKNILFIVTGGIRDDYFKQVNVTKKTTAFPNADFTTIMLLQTDEKSLESDSLKRFVTADTPEYIDAATELSTSCKVDLAKVDSMWSIGGSSSQKTYSKEPDGLSELTFGASKEYTKLTQDQKDSFGPFVHSLIGKTTIFYNSGGVSVARNSGPFVTLYNSETNEQTTFVEPTLAEKEILDRLALLTNPALESAAAVAGPDLKRLSVPVPGNESIVGAVNSKSEVEYIVKGQHTNTAPVSIVKKIRELLLAELDKGNSVARGANRERSDDDDADGNADDMDEEDEKDDGEVVERKSKRAKKKPTIVIIANRETNLKFGGGWLEQSVVMQATETPLSGIVLPTDSVIVEASSAQAQWFDGSGVKKKIQTFSCKNVPVPAPVPAPVGGKSYRKRKRTRKTKRRRSRSRKVGRK